MSRTKALVLMALLGGCHLIGGTDGLVIIDSSDESSSVTTAATGGATAASVSSTGGGATCSDDVCAQNASECETCACLEGLVCDCTPMPFGQTCSIGYCDSDGSCVECLDDTDHPCMNAALNCEEKTCVAASCSDGEINGGETDLDCGGPCPPCANGQTCAINEDCQSALCVQTICTQCNTHADCGAQRYCEGSVCHPKKGLFDSCSASYQCLSNYCGCIGLVCGCV